MWLTKYYIVLIALVEWTLVSENQECSGSEINKFVTSNAEINDCATQCRGVSSMFIFSSTYNNCYCETSATAEGTCDIVDISTYNLYKYGKYSKYKYTLY